MSWKTTVGDKVRVHYRVTIPEGDVLFDTWADDEPAVLTLGQGEIAESLEKCLIGLEVGEQRVFHLEPEQAFGLSDPDLLQRIDLELFPQETPVEVGNLIEFSMPNSELVMGVVMDKTEEDALVDFNHPLCDHPLKFEVEMLEVLS